MGRIARLIVLLTMAAVLTGRAGAQPQATLVISNDRLIDGTGSPPLGRATIVISGDRIAAVAAGDVPLPAGARRIDASGLTVLPGFIDTHVHAAASWMWPLFLHHRSSGVGVSPTSP